MSLFLAILPLTIEVSILDLTTLAREGPDQMTMDGEMNLKKVTPWMCSTRLKCGTIQQFLKERWKEMNSLAETLTTLSLLSEFTLTKEAKLTKLAKNLKGGAQNMMSGFVISLQDYRGSIQLPRNSTVVHQTMRILALMTQLISSLT